MKVLITHPEFKDFGGVSNYFEILKDKLNIQNSHFSVGKRHEEKNGPVRMCFRLFNDYLRFIRILQRDHYDLIHINPSLDFKSFVRDSIFVLLAKLYKRKVVVFFHGWQEEFEKKIEKKALWIFRLIFQRADAFIVLASEVKKKLREWGLKQPVYIETTVVDDDILKDFDIKEAMKKRAEAGFKILFFSRIIKEKGIYEAVEAFVYLKRKLPDIELVVAGDGEELQNIKDYVENNKVSNVSFTGYVRGEEKRKIIENSHLYCFPSYREGMPISVLETMAFGLPVVTRYVGGLKDFFENEKHGFATDSKNPVVFSDYMEKLVLDKELYEKIALNNYTYAQETFLASKAAIRLEKIYNDVFALN